MITQASIPARDASALAAHLTSPVTGILRRIGLHRPAGGDGGLYRAFAEPADARLLGLLGEVPAPGGSGFSAGEAVTRALFEAVERYCGAFFDQRNAVLASPDLPSFLHGAALPLYIEEQYRRPGWPFVPLRGDSRLWWSAGVCLRTGQTRYIPSALVHIPYRASVRDECLGPSLSTGMAAGWSWGEACLSGLYEVCERDAFALMWARRSAGPRLLPSPGSRLETEAERVRAALGAHVTFSDITNELCVPTAVAVVRRHYRGRPVVSLGSAAKPCLEEACRKALAEAFAVSRALEEYLEGPDAGWAPEPDFSNVTDWKWHALLYTRPDFAGELDFITASTECKALGDAPAHPENLRSLTERLRPHFPEIVAVDLTTPELAEIPVCAVKVVVPHAVPLEPDHRYQRLAVPRLQGCGARNSLPHPFY